ncbi:MAG: hypothetical protein ACLFPS_01985 [Clostridia bacterium]
MSNKGFASITFVVVFLIIVVILLEVFTIYEIYRSTKNDIDQILNMVLNNSFNKGLRESVSIIEESSAVSLFDKKLHELSSRKEYKDKVNITFTKKEVSSYPAYFGCEGFIQITPTFIKGFDINGLKIELPFKTSAFIQLK